jgi:hypothetical protein
MEEQEQKKEQTLEKSARYISSYLKFELKKDLDAAIKPLCQILHKAISVFLGGNNGR